MFGIITNDEQENIYPVYSCQRMREEQMLEGGIEEGGVVVGRRRAAFVRLPVTRQDRRLVISAQEGHLVVPALEGKEPKYKNMQIMNNVLIYHALVEHAAFMLHLILE